MKNSILFFILLIINPAFAQKNNWQMVGNRIKTPWADSVNPNNVLPEYPRPQMQRKDWINLNGLWQYSVMPASDLSLIHI